MQATKTLINLTGNRFKFEVAQWALRDIPVVLEQVRLPVPEIQSNSVQEIAEFSAQWAATQIAQPFFLTDAGFYIDALNGFPGPFIKFINQWFNTEDIQWLMHDKSYRHMTVQDCLAYVIPGEPVVIFHGSYQGTIAREPGPSTGTPIERLFIPAGHHLPISEFTHDEQVAFWGSGQIWQAFRRFLTEKDNSTD
jgi:XTP/dITP diphosphohydrolase